MESSKQKIKTAFSWSGGKDSALGWLRLTQKDDVRLCALFTTIKAEDGRVPFHEITNDLLEKQLEAIGLPYQFIEIPLRANNVTYEKKLSAQCQLYRKQGITEIAFADLFLEEIRSYREALMKKNKLTACFPLWRAETTQTALDIINSGIKAIVTCVDLSKLSSDFLGKEYNEAFVKSLPSEVDPCGENGEFHTFVYDTPYFKQPVAYKKGNVFTTYNDQFAHMTLERDD